MADLLYSLDTSIVVEVLRNNLLIIARLGTKPLSLSSVAFGELCIGARRSSNPIGERQRLEVLAERISILPCDRITSDYYAAIKFLLRAKGKPIPENDVWIAAIAIQHRLTLATRDHHFLEIENLQLEVW